MRYKISALLFISALILVVPACFTASADGQLISLRAQEDVYVDLGDGQVYDEEVLRCRLDAENGTIPGLSLVKFDLSGLNLTDDQVAILALKASLVERRGLGPTGIAVLSTGSDWTEDANSSEIAPVLEPVIKKLRDGFDNIDDVTSVRLAPLEDDAWIFTFDVTKAVSTSQGHPVSFAMVPINEVGYTVDFRSRETGEGPVLMVIGFPVDEAALVTKSPVAEEIEEEEGVQEDVEVPAN